MEPAGAPMVARCPVVGQQSTVVASHGWSEKEHGARLSNVRASGGWRSMKAKDAVYFPTQGSVEPVFC